MTSLTPYSKYYGDYATSLEELIQLKIKRKLSDAESNALRNAGSLMLLDDLDKRIQNAASTVEIEQLLNSCINLFQERYELGLKQIQDELQQVLIRELRVHEVSQLKSLKNLHEVMIAIETIHSGQRDIQSILEAVG
jgi:uncharacterized protein YaaW (UPF0174 family)